MLDFMDIHDEIQKNIIQLVRNDTFKNKFKTIIINGFIQNNFGYFNLESDVKEGDFILLKWNR